MSLQHHYNFTGTIFLAADHAGYEMKEFVQDELSNLDFKVHDLGAHEFVEDDDYPETVLPVATAVTGDKHALGIVFGGSGQGEAIVMNRHRGVRAAVFYGPENAEVDLDIEGHERTKDGFDIIRLARMHNNANVLSLGARFLSHQEALKAVKLFIGTAFTGATRHERRIKKIDD